MFSMKAFTDEFEKIAETKCRGGTRPIRVHNLVKKDVHDGRRAYEKQASEELKAIGKGIGGIARRHAGKAALVGAGVLGWEQGKQALDDYKLGRMYRQQSQQ
jgi:hypothetical protein